MKLKKRMKKIKKFFQGLGPSQYLIVVLLVLIGVNALNNSYTRNQVNKNLVVIDSLNEKLNSMILDTSNYLQVNLAFARLDQRMDGITVQTSNELKKVANINAEINKFAIRQMAFNRGVDSLLYRNIFPTAKDPQ